MACKRHVFTIILVALILCLAPAFAQSTDYQKISTNLYQAHYANGLRVILKVDRRSPVLFFSIWYRVGSADEHFGITGISHFVEHLLFRGTKNLEDGQYARQIASYGGQQNAFTSNDYTAYYAFVPVRHWLDAAVLDADRMHHLVINTGIVDKERRVIREERRLRVDDRPVAYAFERLHGLYMSSPYAHPVIGWPSDVKQINDQDLYQWYYRWYQPQNAVIVAVGDVKPQQFFKQIAAHYSSLLNTNNSDPVASKAYMPLLPVGQANMSVHWGKHTSAALISYQVPVINTVARSPWPAYTLQTIAYMLAGSNNAILMQQLVHKQHLAVSVAVYYDPFLAYDTAFTIVALPAASVSIAKLRNAITKIINHFTEQPDIDQQLAWAKMDIHADYIYQNDSFINQGRWLGRLASVGLPLSVASQYVESIQHVTLPEVDRVIEQYFVDKNMKCIDLLPNRPDHRMNQSTSSGSTAKNNSVALFGPGVSDVQMA